MIISLLAGTALLIVTTMVHATGMVTLLHGLKIAKAHDWDRRSRRVRLAVVAFMAMGMFLTTMIEAGIWAATYLAMGAIAGWEPAMYFSTVTYTTLGFGDVTLQPPWRLLAAMQGANGAILLGWTTALLFATVHRVYLGKPVDHPGR